MHNLLTYSFIFFAVFSLTHCGKKAHDATKRPKSKVIDKGDYQKYENDFVGTYRKTFTFKLPPVSLPEDTVIIVNRSKHVEKYFEDKDYLYIEASEKLFKLLDKSVVEMQKEEKKEEKTPVVVNTPKKTPSVIRIPLEIKGYRVQIYTGLQRAEAQEIQRKFGAIFPSVGRYLVYIEPNFRVRVGDFATRPEAEDFARSIKKVLPDFSGAFVISDMVKNPKVEELKRMEEMQNSDNTEPNGR